MIHRRMVAPINSTKHYVQFSNAATPDGTIRGIVLVDGVVASAVNLASEVEEGGIVKAVFIEWWYKGNSADGGTVQFTTVLEKVPAGATSISVSELSNLMTYPNKKNILFTSQGVLGDLQTQAIPVIRNWFKIPKGKQRFGLGDRLILNVIPIGATMNNCGFSIYKEYK